MPFFLSMKLSFCISALLLAARQKALHNSAEQLLNVEVLLHKSISTIIGNSNSVFPLRV